MAGIYTDNQPDFSFLQPGETKSWSQYWYPIQKIGPVQCANLNAAVNLWLDKKRIRIGVNVTRSFPCAVVRLERNESALEWDVNLNPGRPFVLETGQSRQPWKVGDITLRVLDSNGREIICYNPKPRIKAQAPLPATEPLAPEDIASSDELYLTGLHLDQYRHATRSPVPYWREALQRDPFDARCNTALGLWHLRRGEFAEAEARFRKAIERLTRRNANPYDGEASYSLGLSLRYVGRDADAYDSFYKASWNQAWAGASYHALAEIDCVRKDWSMALDHLNRALSLDAENLRARNLKVIVLRKLCQTSQAAFLLEETLDLDRLDWWARHLSGEKLTCDIQTRLDIAYDYARAGFYNEAVHLLAARQNLGASPLVHYTLGWLAKKKGKHAESLKHFQQATAVSPDYCFPSRLEEIGVLQSAMRANPKDARAPYYLGNLFYDRHRHEKAIALWERSAKLDGNFSIVWRNLGIGYFNIRKQSAKARRAYDRAYRSRSGDARLLFERDQLWKRLRIKPERRLHELTRRLDLVLQRDDLSIELCALYNQTGRHEKAAQLVGSRKFQPWEGGEGGPLEQHVRSQLALGQTAFAKRDFATARSCFERALRSPHNLSEAKHLLANQSNIHYWLGCACVAAGDSKSARHHWSAAANFKGDFQEMSVRAFSEMTYYSAMSLEKLGQLPKARKLFQDLLKYARKLQKQRAKIDYFATSLPTMLLFEDDLRFRQETTALFLRAQAHLGLGRHSKARSLLQSVLHRDPNHSLAADFLREVKS